MAVKYPRNVAHVLIYPSPTGIRYTCRDADGKVVFDSKLPFRSRRDARRQVDNRWPKAIVTYDNTR